MANPFRASVGKIVAGGQKRLNTRPNGGKQVWLRPRALDAYRRMVAAARAEVPEIAADPRNLTIFSVIKEDEKVEGAFRLLREICGNLDDPATGIAFTIPVNDVMGLARELGS